MNLFASNCPFLALNCIRCHHTHQAHTDSKRPDSLLKVGRCLVPGCDCQQYADKIETIDEDLL